MLNDEKIKVFCGECKRQTNHVVLCKRSEGSEDGESYYWSRAYYFCQCAGCEEYQYAIYTFTEDDYFNSLEEEPEGKWKTYPTQEGTLRPMDHDFELPYIVRTIYHEVVEAINANLSLLAAVGLRSLIEAICNERGVKGNVLKDKIAGLEKQGVLAAEQAKILHAHRFMGNVAAHHIKRAKRNEILVALEIAEALIKAIYVVPALSKKMTTGQP